MLYLFSGRKRRNSLAWFIRRLAKKFHYIVEVVEVDLRHSPKADCTQPEVQKKWLQFIDSGAVDALVITPPCSTFSRATWANEEGPFPLRSSECLRGFTWNSPQRRRKATLGNVLADFSFEAMKRQLRIEGKLAFMEQPEDLGRTNGQRIPGHRPGSMWQFPQHEEILQLPGVRSVALAQLDFGAESVKPTRLLMRTSGQLHPEMYEGLPQLDGDGWYLGPLPKKAGKPLIGKQGGAFRKAGAAAWPAGLCSWVAEQILAAFQMNSESRGGQVGEEKKRGAAAEVEGAPLRRGPGGAQWRRNPWRQTLLTRR